MASNRGISFLNALLRSSRTPSPFVTVPLLRPYPRLPRTLQPAQFARRYAHQIPKPSRPVPPAGKDDGTNGEKKPRKLMEPHYELTFTCVPCSSRSTHTISKQGYHKGSVLITCPSCRNRHVISDHLNIFGDRKLTIEDLMKERGQLVKRGTLGVDGDIEFWEDGTQTERGAGSSTAAKTGGTSELEAPNRDEEASTAREPRNPTAATTASSPATTATSPLSGSGPRPQLSDTPSTNATPSTRRQYHMDHVSQDGALQNSYGLNHGDLAELRRGLRRSGQSNRQASSSGRVFRIRRVRVTKPEKQQAAASSPPATIAKPLQTWLNLEKSVDGEAAWDTASSLGSELLPFWSTFGKAFEETSHNTETPAYDSNHFNIFRKKVPHNLPEFCNPNLQAQLLIASEAQNPKPSCDSANIGQANEPAAVDRPDWLQQESSPNPDYWASSSPLQYGPSLGHTEVRKHIPTASAVPILRIRFGRARDGQALKSAAVERPGLLQQESLANVDSVNTEQSLPLQGRPNLSKPKAGELRGATRTKNEPKARKGRGASRKESKPKAREPIRASLEESKPKARELIGASLQENKPKTRELRGASRKTSKPIQIVFERGKAAKGDFKWPQNFKPTIGTAKDPAEFLVTKQSLPLQGGQIVFERGQTAVEDSTSPQIFEPGMSEPNNSPESSRARFIDVDSKFRPEHYDASERESLLCVDTASEFITTQPEPTHSSTPASTPASMQRPEQEHAQDSIKEPAKKPRKRTMYAWPEGATEPVKVKVKVDSRGNIAPWPQEQPRQWSRRLIKSPHSRKIASTKERDPNASTSPETIIAEMMAKVIPPRPLPEKTYPRITKGVESARMLPPQRVQLEDFDAYRTVTRRGSKYLEE
ncbi:putative DNL-type domain-containing protein [Seiridium unicorne]|uniref:DNL-type domain-containing protein n=1 Tax=Seiridium unicorne TaxID=138068 RepID=A0ABR2UT09_9PEZI